MLELVDGNTNWAKLFLRDDNVYVRGFTNQHNSHELTEPVNNRDTNLCARSVLLPSDYQCVLLQWDVKYWDLLGCKTNDEVE